MCFRQMWWPGSHLELDCDHLVDGGSGENVALLTDTYRSPVTDMEGDRSKI